MTEPAGFKKGDLRRAISAMRAEGLEPVKVSIAPNGEIALWCGDTENASVVHNEWDIPLAKTPPP